MSAELPVHGRESDLPHSLGGGGRMTTKWFRVSKAVLRDNIVKWTTGFQ